jgi:predicted DNA-binding protein (UPF0251 family)
MSGQVCLVKVTFSRIKLWDRTRIEVTDAAEKCGMSRKMVIRVQNSGVHDIASFQNVQTEAGVDGCHSRLDRLNGQLL